MSRPIVLTPESCVKRHPGSPVYHFEKQVPKSLREKIGRTRWRHSLNTTDYNEAIRLAAEFIQEVFKADDAKPSVGSMYLKELDKLRALNMSWQELEDFQAQNHPRSGGGFDESKVAKHFAAGTLLTGNPHPTHLFTLGDMADQYFRENKRNKEKEERAQVRRFGDKVPLDHLSRPMVVQYIKQRESEGVRRDTIKRDIQVLRNVAKFAVDMGLMTFATREQLFQDHTFKKEEKAPHEYMPQHTFAAICRKLGAPRMWPLVVARLHGTRLAETYNLEIIEQEGILCFRVLD